LDVQTVIASGTALASSLALLVDTARVQIFIVEPTLARSKPILILKPSGTSPSFLFRLTGSHVEFFEQTNHAVSRFMAFAFLAALRFKAAPTAETSVS
jgi:hypothetical protein